MKKTSIFFTTFFALAASAASNPEKDSVRIASGLRSFSNQEWARISGDHSSEKYDVAKGDTLWDISARLFGEAKVWPKVWEINNSTVLNPHMIEPRMGLVFHSGSGTSLPSLVVRGVMNNSGVTTVKNHYTLSSDDRPGPVWDEKTPFPASEWRKLPRQSWENVSLDLPENIDKDGFDTRNRIYLRKPATGLELPHAVACSKIQPLGEVEGTRSVTSYVYRGSEITIRAKKPLEINRVYTLMDPAPSELSTTGRRALSYDIIGKVKILGVQNGLYVGEVQAAREAIMRGAILVPEIKRIEKTAPIAGSSKVKGTILADRRTGAFMSGHNKWVYVDRGTRDGVAPGMIFRIFQNQDPATGKRLTPGDVFVSGDAQIVQGCEDFSIGTFLWSRGEVPERYDGILLTDINDEKIRFYFNGEASDIEVGEHPSEDLTPPSAIIDAPKPEVPEAIIGPAPVENTTEEALVPEFEETKKAGNDEDWLDKLDNHKELEGDEENELRELEKFRESEAAMAPAAPAESTPDPSFPAGEPAAAAPPASMESAPSNSAMAPADPEAPIEDAPL